MIRQYLSNMNIRIIIREEIGDSLDWIQDTMSNQDIAQDIADETEIKNGRLYTPFSHSHFIIGSSFFLYFNPIFSFTEHCKERYGLNEEEYEDVWERYIEIIKDEVNNLNESDDLKWVQDVEPNFDGINLRVGDMFRVPTVNEDGSTFSILIIIDIGLRGNKPITYKIESGMGQLQQRNVVDTKVDFIQRIIKDKWRPLYGNKGYKLNESDDFDWVKEIETDLVSGEIYDIKTGNGYYWVPELYLGKEWDEEHNFEYYKFKGLGNSGGSGRKSKPYIKDLIEKGDIRPYDPSWSIKDELTFSDNIEDALKGNFVIYFKDGTYLGQTLAIQDKLFEMGFSFYTKGPNEYITNKDFSDKIQFFECFNWDNSKPRYKSMPPDQWDQKKILLNKVNKDDINWGTPNPRLGEQELFIAAKNHDATIINGDKYITNDINESNDLIRKELDNKLVGKISNNILNESDDKQSF